MRVLTALVCFTFSEAKVNYHESNAVYIKTMQGLGELLLKSQAFPSHMERHQALKSQSVAHRATLQCKARETLLKSALTFRPADTAANKSRRRKRWRLGLTRAGAAGE